MINVVYLVSELRPSGPINQALNLVSSFDKKKVNAMIVTLFNEQGTSWEAKFIAKNIKIHRLNATRTTLFRASQRLKELIKENNIHIVHSSGISANIVNRLLGDGVKKVTTFRSHINDLNERSGFCKRFLSKVLFQWAIKGIDTYVCCSHSLSVDMSRDLGVQCQFVQNGADIDHYKPVSQLEKIKLREKLSLPIDKKIFVSMGVIEDRKNMPLIVDAVNRLNNDEIYLMIVGWGEDDKVAELSNRIDGNPNIKLTGFVNDPLEYYQCADYFVSASFAEGLPNTVLEAMSCGLPTILSDIGPHREMLQYAMDAGVIFNHFDVSSLVDAIKESLRWDIIAKSELSRNLIEKHLSKYCTSANYTKIYLQTLNE
ncbi:MAG: glycosyltransferase family 4 protein [Rikenellaceae bacterium]|nr:glycosyltransferase family 4 protein [Rikenellaceae bacterium]